MFIHQLKSGELIDLWVSLEELTGWSRGLMSRGVSAGLVIEGCPGGRWGSSMLEWRGVTPFIFV